MNVQIVQSLPTDQWRAFVEQHHKGNIFHTPEMFHVFQQTKGHVPEVWAAVDANEILALFLPVHISLQDGFLRRLTTRTVVYGSALAVSGERGAGALRQILEGYKRSTGRQSLFTEARNIAPLDELLPVMQEQGFAYEDHLNYLINLDRSAEAVFQGIGRRTRRNIKNALNKALVAVEELNQESDLAQCYGLLDRTYQAAHVPLADISLFEAAFRILGPKNMVRFTLAKVGERAASTSVELLYKDVLYGWYGGTDRAYTALVPNELLMWHILKWGAEQGYRQYDFGGAGTPDEEYGVRDFKAKFGGTLVCYGRNTWAPNPRLLSISTFGYDLIRRLVF